MIGRITIALLCLAGLLVVPASAAADEIDWMYDPDAVVEIQLGGLSEAELDELEVEPDEYVKGTFELTVDGVPKGPLLEDVGIRRKGGLGSKRPIKTGKSGLKVRFDEFVKGQRFFGIKRLTLNNMVQDASMVHETLTYEIFHALGLPASRTGYAFVTLNGADYGLFLNLETLDEVSLPRWFETTQHLYEADATDTDLIPGGAGKFEVDEGDEEDIGDLEALIAAVGDEAGDWSEGVSPFADLEQMTAQWAVERYVSHWDGYVGGGGAFLPHNYYLHSDAAGVFQMMPWGTDQTWEFAMPFDDPAGGVMFDKCLADGSCRRLYLEGLRDVLCVVPGLDLPARAAQLESMLAPYQDREDPSKREATADEIAAWSKYFQALAASRPGELEDYLTSEGALEAGEDPCTPLEPEEPTPPIVTPTVPLTAAPPPAGAARIGDLRLKGAFVLARLEVTGAARATLRAFTRIDGHRRGLCADQFERHTAGRLIVRCRLPDWALGRLAERPLKLRARIGFFPAVGTSRTVLRRLTAPRR